MRFRRVEFGVTDASAVNRLTLSLMHDNGFVAYLNGVRVAEGNAPAEYGLVSSTALARSPSDSEALDYVDFDLTDYVPNLVNGTNVLAVHLLNHMSDLDDMLLVPRFVAAVHRADAKTGYLADPSPGAENAAAHVRVCRRDW